MKKILLLIILLSVFFIILSSCSQASAYNSLSPEKQAIVDKVISNRYRFNGYNGIRFSQYNGQLYLVATKAPEITGPNAVGAYAAKVTSTRFFIVSSDSFEETKPDVYELQTQYGSITAWDSDWDREKMQEVLTEALNSKY